MCLRSSPFFLLLLLLLDSAQFQMVMIAPPLNLQQRLFFVHFRTHSYGDRPANDFHPLLLWTVFNWEHGSLVTELVLIIASPFSEVPAILPNSFLVYFTAFFLFVFLTSGAYILSCTAVWLHHALVYACLTKASTYVEEAR